MNPHSRCNFITDDMRILVGARPELSTIKSIMDFGVGIFINLEELDANAEYISKLAEYKQMPTVIRLPITNGRAPSKKAALCIANTVISEYKNGKIIYIHCRGGHGRAGMFGALILGLLSQTTQTTHIDAFTAINQIEHWRNTRTDLSRNFIPTPETNIQVKFLVDILGMDEGHYVDRSDRSWLNRVKLERKTISMETPNTSLLHFYDVKGQYGFLSNFYTCELIIDDKHWKTVEHYFQAAKFDTFTEHEPTRTYIELIQMASTPGIAKILANQKIGGGYPWRTKLNADINQSILSGVCIRRDWETVKDSIMYKALHAKFSQNPVLLSKLLETEPFILVEHTHRDAYWGDGGNGLGKNILGLQLTALRTELQKLHIR